MRICFITKYPPIQGGTCATTYWLAYGLAEKGHQVFVVTNADEVESAYRMVLFEEDKRWLEPTFESTGGFVKVFQTERFHPAKMQHIPCTNPFVSKLASTATQVIRQYDCELIFSFYYEPYAVAGHLASSWTGRPLVVRHAGSDLDRLMKHPGLATTYKEILKSAAGVLTLGNLAHRFLGIGVAPENLYLGVGGGLRKQVFHPEAPPLDLKAMIETLGWNGATEGRSADRFDPDLPTIGIYGKVGEPKGSYDLVRSLSLLRKEGVEFNLVALTQGRQLAEFQSFLSEQAVADRAWILPFIAHWKIPGFIRSCTAVCFLERAFPIKIHRPKVALEILACGTCLILSGEIAAKQLFQDQIVDRENVLLVRDPRACAELADALRYVIADPDRARSIGRRGSELIPDEDRHGAFLDHSESLFRRVLGQPSGVKSFKEQVEEEHRARGHGEPRYAFVARLHDLLMPWMRCLFPDPMDSWHREFLHPMSESELGGNVFGLAGQFCDFVENRVDAILSPSNRPIVRDLLRFQQRRLQTRFDRAEDRVLPFTEVDQLDDPREFADTSLRLRPLRSNYSIIEEFDHDVFTLLKHLVDIGERSASCEDRCPDRLLAAVKQDSARSKTWILFFKSPNLSGGVLQISKATKNLLDLCDGVRQTTTILEEICNGTDRGEDVGAASLQALHTLYRQGAIVFV